jgi:hypothetical protein
MEYRCHGKLPKFELLGSQSAECLDRVYSCASTQSVPTRNKSLRYLKITSYRLRVKKRLDHHRNASSQTSQRGCHPETLHQRLAVISSEQPTEMLYFIYPAKNRWILKASEDNRCVASWKKGKGDLKNSQKRQQFQGIA